MQRKPPNNKKPQTAHSAPASTHPREKSGVQARRMSLQPEDEILNYYLKNADTILKSFDENVNVADNTKITVPIKNDDDWNSYVDFIELLATVADGTKRLADVISGDSSKVSRESINAYEDSKKVMALFLQIYGKAIRESETFDWKSAVNAMKNEINNIILIPERKSIDAKMSPTERLKAIIKELREQMEKIADDQTNHRSKNAEHFLKRIDGWENRLVTISSIEAMQRVNAEVFGDGKKQEGTVTEVIRKNMIAKLVSDMESVLTKMPTSYKNETSRLWHKTHTTHTREDNAKSYASLLKVAHERLQGLQPAKEPDNTRKNRK